MTVKPAPIIKTNTSIQTLFVRGDIVATKSDYVPTAQNAMNSFDAFCNKFLKKFDPRFKQACGKDAVQALLNRFRVDIVALPENDRIAAAEKTISLFREASRNQLLAKHLVNVMANTDFYPRCDTPQFKKAMVSVFSDFAPKTETSYDILSQRKENMGIIATQAPSNSLAKKIATNYLAFCPHMPCPYSPS